MGVICAMLANDNFFVVPGHGAGGLKCGYVSYMYQHTVYDSCQVGDHVGLACVASDALCWSVERCRGTLFSACMLRARGRKRGFAQVKYFVNGGRWDVREAGRCWR